MYCLMINLGGEHYCPHFSKRSETKRLNHLLADGRAEVNHMLLSTDLRFSPPLGIFRPFYSSLCRRRL